ncbi:MAG: glycine--tRNA ligase subunit beta [Burkholderiales bacterium]|nr:glycine--tRNA ligase subunit beta [Burkholderiales bacterium]
MTTAPLLIELFTEELPPKALQKLGDAFAQGVHDGLNKAGLIEGTAEMRIFATPRRLGVLLANIRDKAPDRTETRKLMPAKVAFDAQGQATPALMKRLEKEGLSADVLGKLERRDEGGTETVFASVGIAGARLAEAAQAALLDSIAKLPIPKVMSYQLTDGDTTVKFVRPAHGLVALHGSEVLNIEVLGLKAGRTVHGHRFQGGAPVELKDTSEYSQRLEKEGHIIAGFEDRRSRIEKLLFERAEQTGNTLGPREDYAALLDEVTALVEYPAVYVGSFEAEFLEVPAECLILTMKQNQKYFPLFHDDGSLSSRFLIVSNMLLNDPRNIIQGNERVVRPRLSDARFFFETDKKTKLADRMAKLGSVVYHNKLGTQLERTERVAGLAGAIATSLGADAANAERAARLAKCDLVTDMVGEFPELQGTMGRYYALHDGEAPEVADAIAQHYQPRFSGDALPAHPVSLAVALADKLETLAGLFSIGQEPTGDKDPFALRRHALGVIRMLIEKDLPLAVGDLVAQALSAFPAALAGADDKLTTYVFDRLIGYLRELGYSALEVDAVVTVRPRWGEIPLRLAAVRAFAALPEAESLAAANKRVANILKKSDVTGTTPPDAARMVEDAEKSLWAALQSTTPQANALFAANDYAGYLKSFAALKGPVDAFFEKVMVNAEDANIRNNRLALLRELRDAMNRVADLSKLAA